MFDALRKRDGKEASPAKSCRELFLENPDFADGFYYVDPDEGAVSNAVRVYCRREDMSTCIQPKQAVIETRAYTSAAARSGQPAYLSELRGAEEFEYEVDGGQLNFLRFISSQATQQITYKCMNAVAVEDRFGNRNKSVAVYTAGDRVYEAYGRRLKYKVITDECKYSKSSEAKTVLEISTKQALHLPILDIAVRDVGSANKQLGVELGQVCFS